MNPENVISPKTRIKEGTIKIIHNEGENQFSIATMIWDGEQRIAMRWNGSAQGKGYPLARGAAAWFIIPKAMALAFAEKIGNVELSFQISQAKY